MEMLAEMQAEGRQPPLSTEDDAQEPLKPMVCRGEGDVSVTTWESLVDTVHAKIE